MASDQPMYLERFIESTANLPPELQRILNTIRDLDERSEDLGVQIQEYMELCLQLKPSIPGRKTADDATLEDLKARIEADQRLLIQFAEEKVQLACLGYDLLDNHLGQLDQDVTALAEELQQSATDFPDMGDASYMDTPAFEDGGSRRGARTRDVSSFDAPDSAAGARTGGGSSRRAGGMRLAMDGDQTPASAAALGEGAAAGAGASARRPASAASKRAAAEGEAGYGTSQNRRRNQGATTAAAAETEATPAREAAVPFTPLPLLPGLEHAAEQPQAPGRLLTAADIGQGLVGRRAELYWPDNNLWYVIEIQSVDLVSRKASIFYTTGEAEVLDLDDICKEGHLSLITSLPS